MADYRITNARVDAGRGGMACGPVGGPIVGEARFEAEDGSSFYVSLAEVDGFPALYKTPESTFEQHMSPEIDEAFWKKMNEEYHLKLGEYADILEREEDELYDVYRFLIYLVRCSWDEADAFLRETDGKLLSEIEIPASDYEDDEEEDD